MRRRSWGRGFLPKPFWEERCACHLDEAEMRGLVFAFAMGVGSGRYDDEDESSLH